MPLLPVLSVVFVGVVGGDKDDRVDTQVQLLLGEHEVVTRALPAATVRKLARHGEGSGEIVANLHVDGLVGGELAGDPKHRVLRMVIYRADGGLDSLFEVPFSGHQLSRDQVSMLEAHFEDLHAHEAPAPKAPPAKVTPKVIEAKPAPAPKAPPPPAKTTPASEAKPAAAEIEMTGDESTPAPEAPRVAAAPAPGDDEVSVDELMAQTKTAAGPARSEHTLRLGAAVGVGVVSRTFSGPSSVTGYASTAVGAARLAAWVRPTARTSLQVSAERTLGMTTPLAAGDAPTTMAHWAATTGYALAHGEVDLGLRLGLGRRTFGIESTDPARAADSSYNFVIAGAEATLPVGRRLTVHAGAAFEPVVSGAEPMEAAFGEARRWALELDGGVDLQLGSHVVLRATAGYQRFSWSWSMAGDRGAGGAVDHYPSGALALGAEY